MGDCLGTLSVVDFLKTVPGIRILLLVSFLLSFCPIDVSQKLIRMHQVCTWFNRHKVCINAVKHYFQKWSEYTLNSNLLLLLFWTWLFSKCQFTNNSSVACILCLKLTKLNFAWFTSLRGVYQLYWSQHVSDGLKKVLYLRRKYSGLLKICLHRRVHKLWSCLD